ncbi:GGDEF domain-containing protein [Aquabacterium sp. A7-Y]|uniref:GGDEF domain-containing protein n=1 Tax=Aquabacterium sp. A7-Y TaxID=1349605 RepID=UPI00223E1554|nr:GGDEF domain-containing protein [Aquabacterium sp. A7-Y]MCW7539508.1 GGDEF domain-containing protein [Aquabacterium sp. A7-Y]
MHPEDSSPIIAPASTVSGRRSTAGRAPAGGPDLRRKGLRRFLLTLPSQAVVALLLWLGVWLDLAPLPAAIGITVFSGLVLATLYLLLHTGLALKTRDPVLAFSQVLFSISQVALVCALIDAMRATSLLWLSVTLVYDIRRLPLRQLRLAAGLSLVMPALATLARIWLRPDGPGWRDDLLNIGLLMVALPVLVALSAQARAVRQRDLRQKEQMADTLAQLQRLSMRDSLTGLFNRRHMLRLLDEEVLRQQRSGQPLCVALLDIDFFKQVNDRYGHAMGDQVLQRFAQLGLEVFPEGADALARWGGEEFLLLMPGRTVRDAEAALRQLRDEVHRHDWAQLEPGLKPTFSAGLCSHDPVRGVAATLERADQALYRAKAGGRDRIELALGEAAAPREAAQASARPRLSAARRSADAPAARPPAAAPLSPAAPRAAEARPRRMQRAVDLVLGQNARVRIVMPRCLLSAIMYVACITALLTYILPEQLLTPAQGRVLLIHNLIGCVVPLTLVRSGLTARLRDPGITLLYMLWGFLGLMFAYALLPDARASVLQMICLSVVFGFLGLTPRQTQIAGAAAIGGLLVALAAMAHVEGLSFDPRRASLEVGMSCFILWLLTLQSHNHSTTRERVRRERDELVAASAQLERVMMRDPLTGLFNRQYMQGVLERERDRHQRGGAGFCVALVDLDHFKRINDSAGHAAGDAALCGFAAAAQTVLRETDVVCRWGGEEFLVLLPEAEPGPKGLQAMNRLREHVAAQRFCLGAPLLQVTFSAGIAAHVRGEPVAELLARADRALYTAKAGGRNRNVVAPPPAGP